MGLIGDFLDVIGLGGITGIDIMFAAMALIGTFLFIIFFILVLIGDFTSGIFDFEMSPEGIFQLFTLQGLLSFIMMFGWIGLAASQDYNAFIAILAGTISGIFSMYMVGKVFSMMKSLEQDNTVEHSQAIGARGTVYRTINPGQSGQVQVEYQGALRTESAIAKDEKIKLETGKFVKVVDVIAEKMIVVPLDVSGDND